MAVKTEKRRYGRKQKEMQVYFVSVDTEEDIKGTGVTRNVSRGGLYFRAQHCHRGISPQKGDKLRLRFNGQRCDGRVLRVDRGAGSSTGGPTGVAVRFHGSPDIERRKLSS